MHRRIDRKSRPAPQRMWTRLGLCAAVAVTPIFAGTPEATTEKGSVVSRVEINGGGHSKLSLHHVDGKRYLYAHRTSDRSLTIIDVTDEENPRVVKTLMADHLASAADVHVLPGGKVLLSRGEAANTAQSTAGYSLSLWHPGNESAPKDVAVVTSHLVESSRGLLYVSSDKGLTLIRLYESPEELEAQRWASTLAP
jgi:hypothetical protein